MVALRPPAPLKAHPPTAAVSGFGCLQGFPPSQAGHLAVTSCYGKWQQKLLLSCKAAPEMPLRAYLEKVGIAVSRLWSLSEPDIANAI